MVCPKGCLQVSQLHGKMRQPATPLRMHYAEYPPAPDLRDVVRCYWFLRADPPSGASPAEPAFPDGSPETQG